jgi:hypothetical protein
MIKIMKPGHLSKKNKLYNASFLTNSVLNVEIKKKTKSMRLE